MNNDKPKEASTVNAEHLPGEVSTLESAVDEESTGTPWLRLIYASVFTVIFTLTFIILAIIFLAETGFYIPLIWSFLFLLSTIYSRGYMAIKSPPEGYGPVLQVFLLVLLLIPAIFFDLSRWPEFENQLEGAIPYLLLAFFACSVLQGIWDYVPKTGYWVVAFSSTFFLVMGMVAVSWLYDRYQAYQDAIECIKSTNG